MNQTDLEQVYDSIAQAIDAVAPEKTEVFLAKLSLSLAADYDDLASVIAKINQASNDL